MSLYPSTISLILIFLANIQAEQLPIHPKLEFHGPNNASVYTINFKAEWNTDNDPLFAPAVQTATIICSVGIWRFYPAINYFKDPVDDTHVGLQIGSSEQYECLEPQEVANIRQDLQNSKSFRYLGPQNLNQFSISLYAGDHATGTEATYSSLIEFQLNNTAFPGTASYLLTGISDDSELNQNRLQPVLKVFWGRNGDQSMNQICLALVNPALDGTWQPKIYYRETLTPVGDEPSGPGEEVEWGSFLFLRYSTALTGFCEIEGNSLGMIKLCNGCET